MFSTFFPHHSLYFACVFFLLGPLSLLHETPEKERNKIQTRSDLNHFKFEKAEIIWGTKHQSQKILNFFTM